MSHFARFCPELETLALTLSDNTHAAAGATIPVQARLAHLRLRYSAFDDLDAFASRLAQMFPRITKITRVGRQETSGLQEFNENAGPLKECAWEELMCLVQHHRQLGV